MDNVCAGDCRMQVSRFIRLTSHPEKLEKFLIAHGCLATEKLCPLCEERGNAVPCTMTIEKKKRNIDEEDDDSSDDDEKDVRVTKYWRCRKSYRISKNKTVKIKQCTFKESFHANTFFSKTNLSLKQISRFVFLYIAQNQPRTIYLEQQMRFPRHTVIDWSNFIREVMLEWAFNSSLIMIGGEGKTVEIDESKVGSRKYNKGKVIDGRWIFGGIEQESKKFFVVPVKRRTKKVLLKIIKEKIAPGTKIISDCWKSYACLEKEGYLHETINYSTNFVDPETGAHTQSIERSWGTVKSKLLIRGRKNAHFEMYLGESLFLKNFPEVAERIHHIWIEIGKLYNPVNPTLPNTMRAFDDEDENEDDEDEEDEDEDEEDKDDEN